MEKETASSGIAALAVTGSSFPDGSLDFMQGSDAPRAQLHSLGHATLVHGDALDVRFPLAFGFDIRVTNVVSKIGCFPAAFALGHDHTSG
jgi:hypothetical protein